MSNFACGRLNGKSTAERMVQLLDIHYRKEGYERISATNPGGLSDKLRDYFAGNLSIIDTLPSCRRGDAISARSLENTAHYPCGRIMRTFNWLNNWAALARRVPLVRQTDRSHQHRRTLPSGYWPKRHHDRICRRSSAKRVVIAPRRLSFAVNIKQFVPACSHFYVKLPLTT